MLRLFLQLAVVAGGIAFGMSKLDSSTMQRIEDAVREMARGAGWGQSPPAPAEPSAIPIGGAAMESGSAEHRQAQQNPVPPKAFYNAPPQECHWEKIIDPEDGTVRCSVPARSPARR